MSQASTLATRPVHDRRPAGARSPGGTPPRRWSAGRVVAVVLGVLLVLTSSAFLTAGLGLRVTDEVARDSQGYLMSSTLHVESPGHAVLTEDVVTDDHTSVADLPERLVGRVKVAAAGHRGDVFVGIGNSDDVHAHLAGVAKSTLVDPEGDDGDPTYDVEQGGPPAIAPGDVDFWLVSAQGPGEQTVSLEPAEGDWTIVVMNADGSSPVVADVRVGATLPVLDGVAYGLLVGGLLLLGGGIAVLWASLHRRTS